MRDLFAKAALAQIPKLLTLLDRNPHSPTYGCFDRSFWQYKVIDFPSGMSQEFVWPLALVYHLELPDNPYFHQPVMRHWVEAGILFAARSAHRDSSCDDYFPFERAGGAAAFSLLACLESYQLLQLDNPEILDFFQQRANWLAHHQESGRLTNHQALIVLCLELAARLFDSDRWRKSTQRRLKQVLSWQNQEGWFQEYEGCDPGYHTLTISCLARVQELNPNDYLQEAIAKAVRLAENFVHPDGSYGGEYTSRNTYNFFPHGFEVVGRWLPEALSINDRFLYGLKKGLAPCYADDRIIGHHTWNYLLAWRDYITVRPPTRSRPSLRLWLQEGGILIDRRKNTELYIALNKGGVFKLFQDGQLIASDTQFSMQVKQGRRLKNAVAHLVDRYSVEVQENQILIQGTFGWAKQKQMTTVTLIGLRLVMYTIGRFFPNLIRKFLQKLLITGHETLPYRFSRRLIWRNGHWEVIDELIARSWKNVIAVGIGCDQTSIYVVMSRTYQPGQLQPWLDLTDTVQQLPDGHALELRRTF